ncbi:hypothetical protein [Saccharopolyspora thermophila]|uniref:hypothetical protein n=1 Tax=Saccharopolyspora thermophila TaxID=89367 RepID=UPI001663E914|nr:hypothetical protein [Saccharopolyspora subtropica]
MSGSRTGSAQGLLDPAWQMRWRVPELALVLSDRAVALARRAGEQAVRLRAEALALFASNRLGQGVTATSRAVAAVRDAEASGDAEVAAQLRVELAWCARSAGSHEVAVRVLEPVLAQERIEPAVRAHALLALAASLPVYGRDGERSDALDEAERLYEAVEDNRDICRLLRARVHVARAGHHRRTGGFAEAVAAADAGLALLEQLDDPAAESGEIRTRLVLERVQSLLESGRRDEAVQASDPVLSQPVRAAAAGPMGWLGLAMATRVHLPDGNHVAAVRVLNDTAAISERHKLDELLAETLNTLSHVHEKGEEFAEALRALRGAYAADRRWRAAVHAARVRLLAEFPALSSDMPGDVAVPRQPSGPQQPWPSEPRSPEPRSDQPHRRRSGRLEPLEAEAPEPRPSDQPVPEPAGGRRARHASPQDAERTDEAPTSTAAEGDTAHDAARALMETLTNRAAEMRAEGRRRKAMPEPRVSEESAPPEPEPPSWPSHAQAVDALIERVASAESVAPQFPAEQAEPAAEGAPTEMEQTAQLDWPPASWEQATEAGATIPQTPVVERASTRAEATPPGEYGSAVSASAADSSSADVTTIMPVISVPADSEPAGNDWPPSAAVAEPGAQQRGAEHLLPPDNEPPQDQRPVEAAQPAEGGRRSRGKSLAEIRASLQLSEEPRSGRRRARHAEPDEPVTPAAEVLARHRQDWATEPEFPTAAAEPPTPEPATSEPRGPESTAAESAETEPAPEPAVVQADPETSGEARTAADSGPGEKISLAELLTEALMAYEDGRRGQAEAAQRAEATSSGRHSSAHVAGIGERSRASHRSASSTSDDPAAGAVARHRRPGMDSAAADPSL